MTAVAVWDHKPTPRELLAARVREGWRPTASGLKRGATVLGYAACIFEDPEFGGLVVDGGRGPAVS